VKQISIFSGNKAKQGCFSFCLLFLWQSKEKVSRRQANPDSLTEKVRSNFTAL